MRVFMPMDEMEHIPLAPDQEAEATDRDDDLGRLFAAAFAAVVPPFPFLHGARAGGVA